jgi:hypothetical protein
MQIISITSPLLWWYATERLCRYSANSWKSIIDDDDDGDDHDDSVDNDDDIGVDYNDEIFDQL